MSDEDAPKTDISRRRAVEISLFVLLAVALVGFFLGMEQAADEVEGLPSYTKTDRDYEGMPARTYGELMSDPLASNQHWRHQIQQMSERTTPPLNEEIENPEEGKEESLALRAQRRAYAGAPPVVPHPVKQRGDLACLACHGDGVTVKGKLAPPMSHEFYVNCTQCHVASSGPAPGMAQTDYDLSTVNSFEGLPEPRNGETAWFGAPPTMPHSSQMRTDCSSCHGVNGREGIRTSHPWRQNCQQCHTPSGALDQRAPLIDQLPPIGN
ncbi:MAG: diheme cytochrome c precursor [Myxococcota bacterium]